MSDTPSGLLSPILVIDDDAIFRERLVLALRDRGLAAHGADNRAAAMALLDGQACSAAVVDLRLGEESGLIVVRELRARSGSMRIIVLTGYGSIVTAKEAIRLGANDYLTKPADADQILAALASTDGDAPTTPPTTAPSLARLEWEHIQRILADCDGNVSKAARVLGIHRRSLQRKLGKQPPPDME